MAQLHELLAVQKTATAQWATILQETLKKLGNGHFFQGFSKSLEMIEAGAANDALQAAARAEKPVTTTVKDTLDYALGVFANSENVLASINATNCTAVATVNYQGSAFLVDIPVDELLGLEDRLTKLKGVMEAVPTQDMSQNWVRDTDIGAGIWKTSQPERTTKTENTMVPVILSPATDKHPAQVKEATKVAVIGTFITIHRTGTATALQKANAISIVTELIGEVKKARMRANMAEVIDLKVGDKIKTLLLSAFV